MRVARGNKSIRRVEGLGLEEKTGGGEVSKEMVLRRWESN